MREMMDQFAGFGLIICTRIIEAHGGTLSAESEVGRGTTFFFTIPSAAGGMAHLPVSGPACGVLVARPVQHGTVFATLRCRHRSTVFRNAKLCL